MVSFKSTVSDVDNCVLKAKACLKLSNWLRQDVSDFSLENIALRMQADFNISDASSIGRSMHPHSEENLKSRPSLSLVIEEMVGTFTKLSSHLSPTMGKSSYASWCYNQARDSLYKSNGTVLQSLSFSHVLFPEILPERFRLTEDEISRVESLISELLQKKNDADSSIDDGGESGNFGLNLQNI